MEWHQIENFIAVAKYKHFTKAAEHQSISQPALSRSIIKLEQELGVRLFLRERKNVNLTRYGEIFLKKAMQAQTSIRKGIEEIQEKSSIEAGEITVAFLHTLGQHFIPKLIANYKKMYPNVNFQLYQGANNYVLNQVSQGFADICLSLPPVQNEQLTWTTLKTEPVYLVVPNNHHLANKFDISFKSLEGEDFICLKQGYGIRDMFDEMCMKLKIQPNITFEGEEATTVAGFVAEGLGITLLPKISEINYDNLSFLNISDYKCQRTIAISSLDDELLTPVVKRFKEFVTEYFASIDT